MSFFDAPQTNQERLAQIREENARADAELEKMRAEIRARKASGKPAPRMSRAELTRFNNSNFGMGF